jgi:dCMP deaminase
MGANRFPEGLHPTPKQIEDIEWKLKHITHAETNAIFRAARNGEKTEGAIMYMPWFPCFDCASAIVDSGIKQIVGHQAMIVKTPEEWFDNMRESRKLLKNARVECSFYDERIGGVNAVFNGEIWHP